jgi:hypothetical protein
MLRRLLMSKTTRQMAFAATSVVLLAQAPQPPQNLRIVTGTTSPAPAPVPAPLPLDTVAPPVPINPNSALGRNVHPRIFYNADTAASINAKIGTGGIFQKHFQDFVTTANANLANGGNNKTAMAFAFIYATYPVPGVNYGSHQRGEYAAAAKTILLGYPAVYSNLENVDWEGVPIAYDWIANSLTAGEKAILGAWIMTLDPDGRTWYADPYARSGIFNAHVFEGRATRILASIALAGDNAAPNTDAWAKQGLDEFPAMFGPATTGTTAAESKLGGDDGYASGEGWSYWMGHNLLATQLAEEAYRTATNADRIEYYSAPHRRWLRYQPQVIAYGILPFAEPNTGSPGGREYLMWKGEYAGAYGKLTDVTYYSATTLAHIGLFSGIDDKQTRLAAWLIANRVGNIDYFGNWNAQSYYWVPWLFCMGGSATAQSPAALGMNPSKVFDSGGQGTAFLKTSWTDINAPALILSAHKWAGQDTIYQRPGHLELHRKGPLVVSHGSGGHDAAKYGWNSNIVVFPDRSKDAGSLPSGDSMGGIRAAPSVSDVASWVPNSAFDLRGPFLSRLAGAVTGLDADYLDVDLTRSFDSTAYAPGGNPQRISAYTRSVVWFHSATPGSDPETVVVFDHAVVNNPRTSGGSGAINSEAYWHFAGEPNLNGTLAAGPTRNGSTAGRMQSSDTTQISATNALPGTSNGSSIVLTPLLPAVADRVIVKAGDDSDPYNNATSTLYQDAYGRSFTGQELAPPFPQPIAGKYLAHMAGYWRVEITSNYSVPTPNQYHLNVFEFGDVGFAKSPTALWGGTFKAARVGSRVAALAPSAGTTSGTIVMEAAGTYKVMIGRIGAPSARTLSGGTNIASITNIDTGADNSLYATVVVTAGGTGAANTLTIR